MSEPNGRNLTYRWLAITLVPLVGALLLAWGRGVDKRIDDKVSSGEFQEFKDNVAGMRDDIREIRRLLTEREGR